MRVGIISLFLLALPLSSFGQLPDPDLTPGAIRTTSAKEICAPSFRTGPYRKTTAAMKKQVCRAYHIAHCPRQNVLELDHLLPLELGGLDDVKNLWPQLAVYPDHSPGFHVKDKLENELHRKVCSGEMSLEDAQGCIMHNWIQCYGAVFGLGAY